MRYLLSRESHMVLARLSAERTLCAFDFDGTLAPIVEHPDCAKLPSLTRDLLACLAALYPCVILSGRARTDLLGKLAGSGVARAVGNHGAEGDDASAGIAPRQVGRWKVAMERELGGVPGLWLEDKGLSLAVHYRQAPAEADARKRILAAAGKLEAVRVFGGKKVVNIVAADAPHKGNALAAERRRCRCTWTLYVGDDENDEEAFALDGNTVAVRIGRKRGSHARYYLRNQAEIDTLLETLVTLRLRAREQSGKKPAMPGDCARTG